MKKSRKMVSIIIAIVYLLFTFPLFTIASEKNTSETGVSTSASTGVSSSELILPELIRSEVAETTNHVARLTEQETSLDTYVFQNSDGTKTMYTFNGDVKYVDSDGEVKDKSNVLSATIEDSAYKEAYAYVNSQNDIRTFFPKQLSASSGLALQYKEYSLSLYPAGRSLAVNPVTKFSSDNFVTYSSAFGKESILKYTPTFDGFKEEILLLAKPSITTFSFIVNTTSLSLALEGGTIKIYPQKNVNVEIASEANSVQPIGAFSELLIYDAAYNVPNDCCYTLTKLSNTSWKVDIVVDPSFFENVNTVYPVTVDPGVTIYTGSGSNKKFTDITLTYTGDIFYVDGEVAQSISNSLDVQRSESTSSTSTQLTESRFVIGFPCLTNSVTVSGVSSPVGSLSVLGSVGTIQSANLWLKSTTNTSATGWIDVYTYLEDWDENGSDNASLAAFANEGEYVTTRGVGNSSGYANMNSTSAGDWYDFSIGSIVREWLGNPQGDTAGVTNPQRGLMFRVYEENNIFSQTFNSSESGSTNIGLVITYTELSYPVPGGSDGDPFNCTCSVHGGTHNGFDINGVPEGTPIVASGYGKVIFRGESSSYGYYLGVRYSNHYVALYAHLQSAPTLSVGATVYQDSTIAYVGRTGNVTGPHLHLGVAHHFPIITGSNAYNLICGNKLWVDPEKWLAGTL